MKNAPPLEHTWTVGQLIEHLQREDPGGESLVTLAGVLRLYRVKRRGPDLVDLEAEEALARDPITGAVQVTVPR